MKGGLLLPRCTVLPGLNIDGSTVQSMGWDPMPGGSLPTSSCNPLHADVPTDLPGLLYHEICSYM